LNSLEELFTVNGILKDTNNDGYANGLKGFVVINENSAMTVKKIAVNLCARIGHESISLDLPILKISEESSDIKVNSIVIDLNFESKSIDKNKAKIELIKGDVDYIKLTAGSECSLDFGGSYLYSRLPYVWEVGENSLKLNTIRNYFNKQELVNESSISKIILDNGYQGIWNLVIRLETDNIAELTDWLKKNKELIKYNNIGNMEFILVNTESNNKFFINVKSCDQIKLKNVKSANKLNNSNANTKLKEDIYKFNNDYVKDFDIANFYSIKGIFKDEDNDFLPDKIDTKIIVSDNACDEEIIAASNIAAKLSIESLGVEFPIIYTECEFNDNITNPIFIGNTSKSIDYLGNNHILCKIK